MNNLITRPPSMQFGVRVLPPSDRDKVKPGAEQHVKALEVAIQADPLFSDHEDEITLRLDYNPANEVAHEDVEPHQPLMATLGKSAVTEHEDGFDLDGVVVGSHHMLPVNNPSWAGELVSGIVDLLKSKTMILKIIMGDLKPGDVKEFIKKHNIKGLSEE